MCFFAAKLKSTILCALLDGLPDEFSQKMFSITPPGNGNVGLGSRDLSEFGFKVGENSPPLKKITREISAKNKNNFFGT